MSFDITCRVAHPISLDGTRLLHPDRTITLSPEKWRRRTASPPDTIILIIGGSPLTGSFWRTRSTGTANRRGCGAGECHKPPHGPPPDLHNLGRNPTIPLRRSVVAAPGRKVVLFWGEKIATDPVKSPVKLDKLSIPPDTHQFMWYPVTDNLVNGKETRHHPREITQPRPFFRRFRTLSAN
jgi:hypothetical protein